MEGKAQRPRQREQQSRMHQQHHRQQSRDGQNHKIPHSPKPQVGLCLQVLRVNIGFHRRPHFLIRFFARLIAEEVLYTILDTFTRTLESKPNCWAIRGTSLAG